MKHLLVGNGINIQFNPTDYTTQQIVLRILKNCDREDFPSHIIVNFPYLLKNYLGQLFLEARDIIRGQYDQYANCSAERASLVSFREQYASKIRTLRMTDIGFEDYYLIHDLCCHKTGTRNPEQFYDPIQAYMGEKTDMNRANEVRPIFRRLAEVAERTGCAVILIGHLNKAAGGQSAYRGLGSIDFRAAARSVLLIGRVKREPNVRVIIHDKSSLAPEGKPVAFCLDPETGFEWIGEYDITADELLSGAGGNNATKTEQAEKLILDLLADGKELASEDIEKAAADAGISARTVRAAKKNLDGRITSKRIGAAWYHALKK